MKILNCTEILTNDIGLLEQIFSLTKGGKQLNIGEWVTINLEPCLGRQVDTPTTIYKGNQEATELAKNGNYHSRTS